MPAAGYCAKGSIEGNIEELQRLQVDDRFRRLQQEAASIVENFTVTLAVGGSDQAIQGERRGSSRRFRVWATCSNPDPSGQFGSEDWRRCPLRPPVVRADSLCIVRSCPDCGARLFEGAAWCGLCGASFVTGEEAGELLAEATSPGARPAVLPQWRPDGRHTVPTAPPIHSRWKGGPLSFGPLGKIAASVVPTLVAAYFLLYANSPGSGLIMFGMLPLLYREIWRRRRIR